MDNVTTLGDSAFSGCANLSSVSMNNVTTLGDSAFSGCANLLSVFMEKLSTVKTNSFSGCVELTTLQSSVLEHIEDGSFDGTKIKSIALGKNVTIIPTGAFRGATRLATVIAPNVTEIGDEAFVGCKSLKPTQIIPAIGKECQIEKIGTKAFKGCYTTGNIAIPTSVKYIGSDAFTTCGTAVFQINNPNVQWGSNSSDSYTGNVFVCYSNSTTSDMAKKYGFDTKSIDDNTKIIRLSSTTEKWQSPYFAKDYYTESEDNTSAWMQLLSKATGFTETDMALYGMDSVYVKKEDLGEYRPSFSQGNTPVAEKDFPFDFAGMRVGKQILFDKDGHINEDVFDELSATNDKLVLHPVLSAKTYLVRFFVNADKTTPITEKSGKVTGTNEDKAYFSDKDRFAAYSKYTYSDKEFSLTDEAGNGFSPVRTGYTFTGWDKGFVFPAFTKGNLDLVAKWTENTYTATFSYDSKSVTLKYTYKEDLSEIANQQVDKFPNPGYDFLGWKVGTQDLQTGKYQYASDVTVSPVFKAHDYKITFIDKNPLDDNEVSYKYGTYDVDHMTELPKPERKGFVFDGWLYKNENSTRWNINRETAFSVFSLQDISLAAVWKPLEYDLVFQNVEEFSRSFPTKHTFTKDTSLPTLEKAGYQFCGYTGNGLVDVKQINKGVSPDEGDTFYLTPHFEPLKYVITYQGRQIKEYTIEDEVLIQLTKPTDPYKDCIGWSIGEGTLPEQEGFVVIAKGNYGNKEITPVWKDHEVEVELDANGGEFLADYKNATRRDGKMYVKHIYNGSESLPQDSKVVKRKGYALVGWDTKSCFSIPTGKRDPFSRTNTVTMNAIWEAKPYTYTFSYKIESDLEKQERIEASYDGEITVPESSIASKRGHDLVGWETTYEGEHIVYIPGSTIKVSLADDILFSAVWKPRTLNYSFDALGGTWTAIPNNGQISFGELYDFVPANESVSRSGYICVGFRTSTGRIIHNGNDVRETEDFTIYPIWVATASDGTPEVKEDETLVIPKDEKVINLDDVKLQIDENVNVWYKKLTYTGPLYEQLSPFAQKIYLGLVNYYQGGKHFEEPFFCSITKTDEINTEQKAILEVSHVFTAFFIEHKELDWIGSASYKIDTTKNNFQLCISPFLSYDETLIRKTYALIDSSSAYTDLLATTGIIDSDDDATKATKIMLTVTKYVSYTESKNADGTYDNQYRNAAYLVFSNPKKDAVCAGYVSLYTKLCDYYGLESIYVHGKQSEYHAWAYVKIKETNKWYMVDPTFYDTNPSNKYLLAGKQEFDADREDLTFCQPNTIALCDYLPLSQTSYWEDTKKTQSDTPKIETPVDKSAKKVTISGVTYVISGKESSVIGIDCKKKEIVVKNSVSLDGVNYPVTTICSNALKNGRAKKLTIGSNVKIIQKNSFVRCKQLKTIKVSGKKLKFVKKAYKNCANRVKIKAPKSCRTKYKKLFKTSGLKKPLVK